MASDPPDDIELPDGVDDPLVDETLRQTEEYYTPVEDLPDDPEELKNYIEELHFNLAKGILVAEKQQEHMELWRDELQKVVGKFDERAEEMSDRMELARLEMLIDD
ncbi:hypothetical protein [Haloplanus natans]|uniref:hypothetical protein n=1 Tax=Haloplanus natans TaxID=376171 RepID=UPI000677725E|nr:hypothetical protein [Haloplanus natans]